VDCDRPSPEVAKQATIGQEKVDGVAALVVRGPGGEILRAFADTNGNRVVDRWSYYKDGVEVYRDIDSDHDAKGAADQFRWLNSGGSRWGVDVDGDGAIDVWKQITAEEATAEVVAAIRAKDAATFKRLLPTKADLEAAGFTGERLAELVARAERAAKQFPQVAAAQKQVSAATRWTSMLAPQSPGVLPEGSDGVGRDVSAYDNVVALWRPSRVASRRLGRSSWGRSSAVATRGGRSTCRSCWANPAISARRSASSRPVPAARRPGPFRRRTSG
jgi:hypothetical protein